MGTRSKDRIKAVIAKDILDIHNRYSEVKKSIQDNLQDVLDFFHELHAQIPESTSGPLIAKTPKVPRKRGVQRIETIPEDVVVNNTISDSTTLPQVEKEDMEETKVGRSKREASKKAFNNIKKQQSLTLQTKLRRPSDHEEQDANSTKRNRVSRGKRKQSARSSSDEESSKVPMKQSKMEETTPTINAAKESMDVEAENRTITEEDISPNEKVNATVTLRRSSRKRSSEGNQNTNNKQGYIIGDTTITHLTDVEEPSMYEDAIGKPTPIMSSTMNFNSTMVIQKMMNATVVLEPLSAIKVNETITIKKKSSSNDEKGNEKEASPKENEFKLPRLSMIISPSGKALQDRKMQQIKEAMANKEFDELLTDDESSPELRKHRQNVKKQEDRKRPKRISRSMTSSSDDEVPCTPNKQPVRGVTTASTTVQDIKNTFKSNALFSPYAKESVKKRVEAFEQARLNSPNPNVDPDAPTRITRTKTRAIAAARAEAAENGKAEKTVAQKLARKSLAKAKKISLAKQVKESDDYKENKLQSAQRIQKQQKTTPLGKTKTQLPMSVNRLAHTPVNGQYNLNHNKALSAARTNIITSVDSFLQAPKPISKANSMEKITDEKKRKLNDEDARRKREEALRLQTEEKRRKRQEKELKNKMAREAKEKQDMEKRQKAEKEREEKARLAQQMQEKQREEMEKKRLAQIQRAHIKEEKRKQEEQQRLQRLAEQEEMERTLAEQRRREQEAERRKEAETRAQQQAALEAMRIKNQKLALQMNAKHGMNKNQAPTNYILDSEPDDDESDDESKPKHTVPHWAQPQVRKVQLSIQRYIPEKAVFRFFDTRKCTPDLTQLFHGIDRSRLKRTSSAIWKTPPRYSMMATE